MTSKFNIILALLMPLSLFAERPEAILPKTKVIRSSSWYAEQQRLWEAELKADKHDATVWVNYYCASRYAFADQDQLANIVQEMESSVDSPFSLALVKGFHNGYTRDGFDWIQKAYRLEPSDPATYATLILASDVDDDLFARKKFSEKIHSAGQVSSSLLHYSYNVLMSIVPDGVLITEGENTSIPLFVLQDVFNVRTDVKVLQLELLGSNDFRERILHKHKLLLNESLLSADLSKRLQQISTLLPSQNRSSKFFFALTLSQQHLAAIREQLYVVGLASELSEQRMDNLAAIRQNIETRFLLDYISVDFNGESEFASGHVLSANYLVPMLMLHEYYLQQQDAEKAIALNSMIQKIARKTGKEQLVNNLMLGQRIQVPYFPTQLNLKEVDGIFKKVKDNIYAQEYEVTNAQYNTFLNYLREHNQESLLQRFSFDLSGYEEPALSFMKTYTANRISTKKDKYFTRYPAVSIPYEGAVAYCEWLTEQYNQQADRKYKKVKFRLPAVNEWQIAALGYAKAQSWELDENNVEVGVPKNNTDELSKDTRTIPVKGNDILYPWYRAYNYRNKVLNSRGCSLGNFKFPDNQKPCQPAKMITVDGFVMMSSVQAYFPNDIGLYDVVGNVSEMTAEKGKACGGSWNHVPEESTIRSINTYSKPDPAVGFRVFMEVIEP